MSLPSLDMSASPDTDADFLKDLALPPIDTHRQPGRIEVPFEIVWSAGGTTCCCIPAATG